MKINNYQPISLNEAKAIFNRYYEERVKETEKNRNPNVELSKKEIIKRSLIAKKLDIMYNKPDKYVLKPGEYGSAKYTLPEGPRTFDMVGVDWFPEGTRICLDEEKSEFYPCDNEDNDKSGQKSQKSQKEEFITKGQRRDKEGELYHEKFKEIFRKNFAKNDELVRDRWMKQKLGKTTTKRKVILRNKKRTEGALKFVDNIKQFRKMDIDVSAKIKEGKDIDIEKYLKNTNAVYINYEKDGRNDKGKIIKQSELFFLTDLPKKQIFNSKLWYITDLNKTSTDFRKFIQNLGFINENMELTDKFKEEARPLKEYYNNWGKKQIKMLGGRRLSNNSNSYNSSLSSSNSNKSNKSNYSTKLTLNDIYDLL
jgi:hypothetical protein